MRLNTGGGWQQGMHGFCKMVKRFGIKKKKKTQAFQGEPKAGSDVEVT